MPKHNGQATEESLIQFPCDFTIKVMGKNNGDFLESVLEIIAAHFPDIDMDNSVAQKFSKDHNYLSLSVKVFAQNKAQLDAVYQALSDCDHVLMCL